MAGGRRYESVWEALEESPAAAAGLRVRSDLMIALQEAIRAWGATPSVAAARLDMAEARLSDLLGGDLDRFSLDDLVAIAASAGLAVRLELTPAA